MSNVNMTPAPDQLLTLDEVLSRLRLSRSTVYRWMGKKRFPQPIRFSDACLRWSESDLTSWIASKSSPTEQPPDGPL